MFVVDFDALPARIGDQTNLCAGVGNGECQRKDGEELVHGECRNGRMHGPWSLENVKTGAIVWSGTYCNGLPCGTFHQKLEPEHENVFRIENLHLHGRTTIWQRDGERLIESLGYYENSKRTGRWTRRVEPARTLLSTAIYDDNGFVTTTSYHCTNGNRKEVRGQSTFFYDAQGNSLPDPSPCPLP